MGLTWRKRAVVGKNELYELGVDLLRKLDREFAPKLKYHIVFWAQGAYGDAILTLRSPLETEAAIVEVKQEIQDMFKLSKIPALISWTAMKD